MRRCMTVRSMSGASAQPPGAQAAHVTLLVDSIETTDRVRESRGAGGLVP
jgi:hypothetical protein